ncbi:kelch-like protein diablo [Hydra vulgaris]|uniref:kelch-like protein diablo n=1 Tax=Hydra vulgaris TaxID=6087 RepID=UPI001F5F80D4|nr:kelch-like protein diablo [Hydra vulgaris]
MMKEETVSPLSYNHHSFLSANLLKFRQCGVLCDVTLLCEDALFQVHKVVLAASSAYFQAMFTIGMCEEKKRQIPLNDVDKKALSVLVDYAYTGIISIDDRNVQVLLKTADLLQFSTAKALCCKFIMDQMNSENCLDLLHLADVYHCSDISALSQLMFNENWEKIIKTESFVLLKLDILIKLLSSDNLHVNKEADVFYIIAQWVESDIESRKKYLFGLLEYVRWAFISPKDLNKMRQHPLMLVDKESLSKIDSYLILNAFQIENFHMRDSYIGWMYVLGGEQSFLMEMKTCEFYNNQLKEWNYGFSLNGPRTSFAAITLKNRLYVIGGMRFGEKLKLVECYDQYLGKWKRLASMKKCQGDVEAAVINDTIYVAGGSSGGKPACRYVEKYDICNNQWSAVASMKSRRRRFGLCEYNSRLYVFGGFQDSLGELSVCESFCPITNMWESIAPMKTNRCDLGVTVLSDFIYVTGGVNSYAGSISTVEKYDPALNTWSMCQPLIHARGGHTMVTYFGRAVAIGGMNSYMQTCNDAEWYNEVTDQWSTLPLMNMPRFGGVGIVLPFCKQISGYKENRDENG